MEPATIVKESVKEEKFQLTERINRISVSPTMAVLQAAEQLKAKGIDVVDFGPGEPDFPTPEHIKRAAIKALEDNRTKYTATAGIAPLRQAICDWHAANLGSSPAFQSAECVVTSGGKQAIFNAASVLVSSGDEVDYPGAILGKLSGHREVCGRQAGIRAHARGRRFPAARFCRGEGHHVAHADGDRQLALQSERSGDSAG